VGLPLPCDDKTPCCVGSGTSCKCKPCSFELESVISQAFRVTGGVSLFFSFTEVSNTFLVFFVKPKLRKSVKKDLSPPDLVTPFI